MVSKGSYKTNEGGNTWFAPSTEIHKFQKGFLTGSRGRRNYLGSKRCPMSLKVRAYVFPPRKQTKLKHSSLKSDDDSK